ncbi:MAG: helicase-related protein [Solirubrobacteraceae bacterium]
MKSRPYILDNQGPDSEHAQALTYLIGDVPAEHPLAVATGFVNLGGLHHLASIADGRPTRLLIGAQPAAALGAALPIGLFEEHLEMLRDERDLSRFPPSRAARELQAVERWLKRPEVQVRRYVEQFLHGKAYLFGDPPDARVALVTSANLTGAGLHRNLELGVANYDPPVANSAVEWFDTLWERAVDYEQELQELLFPDRELLDPYTIYLRALLELQEPPLDEPSRVSRPTGLELARFQADGYERARAICSRHGGVVYADGVGTGKTEIGLAFIEERTNEDGVFALVITPAQLAKRWKERIDQTKLSAQVISFNELAVEEELVPEAANRRRVLHNKKDAYRLVIVDEAHALRNEDTTWYRAMERLLGGTSKQVVLLTATPINNGLWDLYNLVMLFARHDRAFAPYGIDSVRELFVAAGANQRDPESLSPDVLFPLADAVSVRRDRAFIEAEYSGQQFVDGTPVRFPTPRLQTVRYDLDGFHPGLLERIAEAIDGLTMARYRPSAYESGGSELAVEAQLAGLLRSGVLKRFESCWAACLATVEHMLAAHEAFLVAWERGEVPSGETLREASRLDVDEEGLAAWLEETLEGDQAARPAGEFDPAYGEAVQADRERLEAIRAELSTLDPEVDPKLAALTEVLEGSPAEKIAVFATYGATVRYLDEHLPKRVGGRDRVVVIGNETSPDQRVQALSRFAPETVVRAGYESPDPVDLLLSTDVLSEGQNLQQAQAVVSYDMPWNPQRVVQRNGRVIRLRSPHSEVFLTTMLPDQGELERLLGLEARIRAKIVAAGVYGMESEVIEGERAPEQRSYEQLRAYAERLVEGDAGLLDEGEVESGAFVGEHLRRLLERALQEGEIERVERLPWGVGACFRQTSSGRSTGPPGVFFAMRAPAAADEQDGRRYWRYVELDGESLEDGDLEILRRIDPAGGEPVNDGLAEVDLERAWRLAAADVVAQHNERADVRGESEQVGPRQRWALGVLRDPAVAAPPGLEQAEAALAVGRSSAVRKALGDIETRVRGGQISMDEAAREIVAAVVERFGLRAVAEPPLPSRIDQDDLGVVCWMAVLAPRHSE